MGGPKRTPRLSHDYKRRSCLSWFLVILKYVLTVNPSYMTTRRLESRSEVLVKIQEKFLSLLVLGYPETSTNREPLLHDNERLERRSEELVGRPILAPPLEVLLSYPAIVAQG